MYRPLRESAPFKLQLSCQLYTEEQPKLDDPKLGVLRSHQAQLLGTLAKHLDTPGGPKRPLHLL